MTIASQTSKNVYVGNGETVAFSYTFPILVDTDLRVSKFDPETGVEEVLALGVDYTVSGAGTEAGGVVTTLEEPIAVGWTILLLRNVPYTQPTDYKNEGSFYPRAHERSFDRGTMQIQQLKERIDSALTLPAQVTGVSTQLPTPDANALIGWNELGTGLRNVPPGETASVAAYSEWEAQSFLCNGTQTAFPLTGFVANGAAADVSVDGLTLVLGADYGFSTLGGITTLQLYEAPALDAVLAIRWGTTLPVLPSALGIDYTGLGAGAVTRSVAARLGDRVSVRDFGATGDGVTNDAAAFQAALDYLSPIGGELHVPPGKYIIGSQLTCSGAVIVRGIGGEVTSATNGAGLSAARCILYYIGPADGTILTFAPAAAGDIIFGCGVDGYIEFDGGGAAAYAVHMNNTKLGVLRARGRTCRVFGFRVSARAGSVSNFSMENRIDVTYAWGANTGNPEAASGGLLLEGNGSTVPATQQVVERCDGLVYNGTLLQIDETDNAQVITTQCSVQSGGTGKGLHIRNVGAQGSNHTVITYCVGPVQIDSGVIGTTFTHYNTEAGGIASTATNWHADLVDYVTGRRYRTPTYALRRALPIKSADVLGTNTSTAWLASQWWFPTFPNTGTPSMDVAIPPDPEMDDGVIESVEVYYTTEAAPTGNFRVECRLSTVPDATHSAFVTPERAVLSTFAVGAQRRRTTVTFDMTSLAFSRGDMIALTLRRLAADALDTDAADLLFLGARVNYRATGPASAGGGTYSVIPSY